jgi:hypothetical protein
MFKRNKRVSEIRRLKSVSLLGIKMVLKVIIFGIQKLRRLCIAKMCNLEK